MSYVCCWITYLDFQLLILLGMKANFKLYVFILCLPLFFSYPFELPYHGYLAQALSFEYQLPVVAIDASSHHASVTNTPAERIKKHYAAKWCDFCHIELLLP